MNRSRRGVEEFLRTRRPRFYCGDCIAWELEVPAADVHAALLALKSARVFDWDVNVCVLCRRERMVMRAA
jgi:hypothetical protein